VHGSASRFYPAETSRFIARTVMQEHLETCPQSRHVLHLEEPDRPNALLTAFADGLNVTQGAITQDRAFKS
jgi:hypothetical protein